MGKALVLETTFLIDLEREVLRRLCGPASEFLDRRRDDQLCVTFVSVGEMAAGPTADRKERWEDFFRPFRILTLTREACWEYGKAYRHLAANGQLIGGNDLWIAATSLAHGMPLVTRNRDHFKRVPGLEVISY